jgi:hypothetical protein
VIELKRGTEKLPEMPDSGDCNIPRNCIVIEPKESKANVKGTRGLIWIKSLPTTPAYAFTEYKCQGRTFDKAVIDLSTLNIPTPVSRGSAYVMPSRVKDSAGLAIVRLPNTTRS